MIGYTAEDFADMSCADFSNPEDQKTEEPLLRKLLGGEIAGYHIEKRFRRKDGAEIWGHIHVSLLKASAGDVPVVIAMVEDISERKAAEAELKSARVELQHLAARLIQAQEEERQRVARELHDDIGQRLSLLMIGLEQIRHSLPETVTKDKEFSGLVHQADELVTDVHALSHQLHSSKLQHLGLAVALRELCSQISRQHHIQIDFFTTDRSQHLPEGAALCLYRVAQEALNNVVKHSRAKTAIVALYWQDGGARMQITDGGVGFDSTALRPGLGLASMRERLRMVGGQFTIQPACGGGTEVLAEVNTAPSIPEAKAS
jgi:PAS domain S-box-containing protein